MFLPPKVDLNLVKQLDQLWAGNLHVKHDTEIRCHIHFAGMALD